MSDKRHPYFLETAISDIIDNSITSGARRIKIATETETGSDERGGADKFRDYLKGQFMCSHEDLLRAVRLCIKQDFEKVNIFLDTLYASGRLNLPLKGILIVGY